MSHEQAVSDHYTHGKLLNAIHEAVTEIGKTTDTLSIEDLAPVDEFHIGGRKATEHFLAQLNITQKSHLLDVGCGLGGAARYVASQFNNQITGIDLTEEYIETGNTLCRWVKLDHCIQLQQGSALSMPFQENSFDGAYMMHVGMNIEDKLGLFKEIHRVLRPGAFLGVYDVMRETEGELTYPVPWATEASTSSLATPVTYRNALTEAGFEVSVENNRREFALNFFKQLRATAAADMSPPPLGFHTLMQSSTATKISNMIQNITDGYVAPTEIIALKSSTPVLPSPIPPMTP